MAISKPIENRLQRCAIYTRKSTSAGLDQPLNSLETQRDVCRAYIKCQEHRHWLELPQHYDDGGYSGGSLKRPSLQRLIADIEANRIDLVIIYKIDRLSRSLTDFVRLMDLFGRYGVSFVSVTQTFDTSDSMGRLVLNILLTFAQFERELTSERIRDRVAERRRRGLYCGGTPPVGYLLKRGGKLVPDPDRAETVRELFADYPKHSANSLAKRLMSKGFDTKRYLSRRGSLGGRQVFYGAQVRQILSNPIYAGYCRYRGDLVKAQIEPLVGLEQWELVQRVMAERSEIHYSDRNFLVGILHDELGRRLRISAYNSGPSNKRRFYTSVRSSSSQPKPIKVTAERVEELAKSTLQSFLENPIKLKEAILSLGDYSPETAKALRSGQRASRRLSSMNDKEVRELFLALVPRAEVTRTELRLLVCCYELTRFLLWDGDGLFRKSQFRPKNSDRFRLLYAPAILVCGLPVHAFPVKPCCSSETRGDDRLVALLAQAADFRKLVLENRTMSVAAIANTHKMGAKHFSRILRVNYLAPDIQAAIMDGTQPADLTPQKILFSTLPLDWSVQRHLFGFPSVDPQCA